MSNAHPWKAHSGVSVRTRQRDSSKHSVMKGNRINSTADRRSHLDPQLSNDSMICASVAEKAIRGICPTSCGGTLHSAGDSAASLRRGKIVQSCGRNKENKSAVSLASALVGEHWVKKCVRVNINSVVNLRERVKTRLLECFQRPVRNK